MATGELIKTEKPAYKGRASLFSEYLSLGEPFTLHNGEIEMVVEMYIMPDALQEWESRSPWRYVIPSSEPFIASHKGYLKIFLKKYYNPYKGMLINILSGLIREFSGFPSPLNLTRKLWFCFDSSDYFHGTVDWSKDFGLVEVKFNIKFLGVGRLINFNNIKHELLHVVSEFHEGQGKLIGLIDAWQKKIVGKIEKNETILSRAVSILVEGIDKSSKQIQMDYVKQELHQSIQHFYLYSKDLFWNMAADSALCVIAIELNDMDFLRYAVLRDGYHIDPLASKLRYLRDDLARIKGSDQFDDRQKRFFQDTAGVLQFIFCFQHMPYEGIAYFILGEDWRPKQKHRLMGNLKKYFTRNKSGQNVKRFRAIVEANCGEKVAGAFLRFYEAFLHIVKAQAIHNDPLDPDIKKQIFDTECLRRAKEAYKLLNREFKIVFEPITRMDQ